MKILLTGGDGMLGTILRKYWKGIHEVINLDKVSGNDLLNCDLNYDVDVVLHLAASSGVRKSLENPKEYFDNNVVASDRLFKAFPNTRILFASSSTAKEPERNPYAMSKYTVEQIAPAHSLGLRFTTIIGAEGRDYMFVPKLLRNDVTFINVDHKRDFIHVSDVCRAITMLLDHEMTGVIDVGTGISRPLSDYIEARGLENIEHRYGDKHERKDNIADITQLTSIGWKPQIDALEYVRQEKSLDKQ
jgi:nucleoside-diphosphate-sugar epimerase